MYLPQRIQLSEAAYNSLKKPDWSEVWEMLSIHFVVHNSSRVDLGSNGGSETWSRFVEKHHFHSKLDVFYHDHHYSFLRAGERTVNGVGRCFQHPQLTRPHSAFPHPTPYTLHGESESTTVYRRWVKVPIFHLESMRLSVARSLGLPHCLLKNYQYRGMAGPSVVGEQKRISL